MDQQQLMKVLKDQVETTNKNLLQTMKELVQTQKHLTTIQHLFIVKPKELYGETWYEIFVVDRLGEDKSELLLCVGSPRDLARPNSAFNQYIELFGLESELNALKG